MISLQAKNAYPITSIFMILIVIGVQWGFYESYTSQFPNFVNSTPVIHIHGALLMTWLMLLIVQPMLIYLKKAQWHRTLGKVSFVLGPLIIISLFLVGRGSYGRSVGLLPEADNLAIMALDVRGFITFTIFWALAMGFRKTPAIHMRFMIATGILAIGPGVGRGLMSSFGMSLQEALTWADLLDLVIVGGLLTYDLVKKNSYLPYATVFLMLLIGSVLWQFNYSDFWQSFAAVYAKYLY